MPLNPTPPLPKGIHNTPFMGRNTPSPANRPIPFIETLPYPRQPDTLYDQYQKTCHTLNNAHQNPYIYSMAYQKNIAKASFTQPGPNPFSDFLSKLSPFSYLSPTFLPPFSYVSPTFLLPWSYPSPTTYPYQILPQSAHPSIRMASPWHPDSILMLNLS
jgi:hypothetical protein